MTAYGSLDPSNKKYSSLSPRGQNVSTLKAWHQVGKKEFDISEQRQDRASAA
jgi:hypothetical protein